MLIQQFMMKLIGEEITGEKLFGKPLYEFLDDDDYYDKRRKLIQAKAVVAGSCTCTDALGAIDDDEGIQYCDSCHKPLNDGEIRHYAISSGLAEDGLLKSNLQRKNKVGRNEPCPCGSGKKYKKCCM